MHKNLFNLSDRRVLITGSNRGIGFSLALGLAQHGATVILNGRHPERLHAAAEQIRQQGLSAEESRFDVTNEHEIASSMLVLDEAGGVEAQYNLQINAIGPGYFITEMTQVLADNPEFDAWVKNRTPARRWANRMSWSSPRFS